MFTGKALNFLKKQLNRLKVVDIDKSSDYIYKWSRMVREIESDNNPMAAAATTSAKGVYQFTDASVNTAKNRMYNMGFFKEEIREISNNPHKWTDEQADCMFLANMFAQRGSDKLLRKVAYGDLEAMKEAYYKFHHTDPDKATIKRVDKLMVV
tara:strand:- start:145 stop:603 length:459 start_codon:yes stop_codon:yes gene_type:complete